MKLAETEPAQSTTPAQPLLPTPSAGYWMGVSVGTIGAFVTLLGFGNVALLALPGCYSVQGIEVSRTPCMPGKREEKDSAIPKAALMGTAGLALIAAGAIAMIENKGPTPPRQRSGLGIDGVVRF